jgi:hypothetical protein
MARETRQEQLHRVYHIAFILRQKLVPDVVPAILHHAGLFERQVSNRKMDPQSVINQQRSPQAIFVTPPIASSVRAQHPVRKVVFALQSNDQGWAEYRNEGSWTWFTAGVLRSPEADRNNETSIEHGVESLHVDDNAGGDRFLDSERQIYRNDVASREPKTHIVEWVVDSDDNDEQTWVENLQRGDKIVVRAWAQYPGVRASLSPESVAAC